MMVAAYFMLWAFVWLLLTWSLDGANVVTALLVSAFVTFMTIDTFSGVERPPRRERRTPLNIITRTGWFIIYILVFLWECVKANFDVAFRVLHPDVPIRPGTVRVKTSLTSDIALTFLANSLTLTPGTTTIDIDKVSGHIYVHWLYVPKGYDLKSRRLPVVERFDSILRRVFE